MGRVLTLARRDLGAYFASPMAYVIAAVFLLVVDVVFLIGVPFGLRLDPIFRNGAESTLQELFRVLAFVLIVFVPLLTMRLMAEEYRLGTIETLMTAPVTDAQVIAGKFIGALGMYAALLAASVPFLALVVAYGRPDYGVVAAGYLGMLLLGGCYIAVGLFASSLTRHQLVAGILGIVILLVLAVAAQQLALVIPPPRPALAAQSWWTLGRYLAVTGVLQAVNPVAHLGHFSRGVIDTRSLVYLGSVTLFFLFLSTKVLESRRWR